MKVTYGYPIWLRNVDQAFVGSVILKKTTTVLTTWKNNWQKAGTARKASVWFSLGGLLAYGGWCTTNNQFFRFFGAALMGATFICVLIAHSQEK